MTRNEFQVDVLPRLMDLAEAFDRKPPSDAALRVWAETLGSVPVRPVIAALQGWSRSKTKFPAPAEVYAAANDADAEEREKRLADEKARDHVDLRQMGRTEQGRRALVLVRDLLAKHAAQPTHPRAWAERILDRYAEGDESIPDIALRMACNAMGCRVEDAQSLRATA